MCVCVCVCVCRARSSSSYSSAKDINTYPGLCSHLPLEKQHWSQPRPNQRLTDSRRWSSSSFVVSAIIVVAVVNNIVGRIVTIANIVTAIISIAVGAVGAVVNNILTIVVTMLGDNRCDKKKLTDKSRDGVSHWADTILKTAEDRAGRLRGDGEPYIPMTLIPPRAPKLLRAPYAHCPPPPGK